MRVVPLVRIVVLGAGVIAPAVVYDLADDEVSPHVDEIVVADINEERAKLTVNGAKRFTKRKKLEYARVDVKDVEETAKLLRGTDVVVNGVIYYYIPQVMEAALRAGVHYVDLGSEVPILKRQLEFDEAYRKAGLLAIPGMGGCPGIINVAARYGVEQLDEVERIILREGWVDFNDYEALGIPLPVPYSLDCILDEFMHPVEIWENGQIRLIEPVRPNDRSVEHFPPPVGTQEMYYIEHPEVWTIGETFKSKGLKYVDYKISFPRDLYVKYKLLTDLGLTSDKSFKLGNVEIVPRDLLRKLVNTTFEGKEIPPNDYDIMRVVVEGVKGGRRERLIVDIHTDWHRKWNLTAQAVTVGSPTSVTAQWMAKG
ncbi:MAG: saccharopine dehydrogenase NADP-binding domain-containing protein, partial [Candidatus Korarchaeum sp.]|nr:saccharopine dehydrogenase NADP-binding domain-containing protein [Candidatus Korarchaeum sp.]MDW8035834.1 saccharopine dehydrogenase NADP-binding domain-containing protein [Candidatus Korarchaeum sp.]